MKGVIQVFENMQLKDFVHEDILQQILSSFTKATGLRAVIVDQQGTNRIVPKNAPDDCGFCRLVRSTDQGRYKCQRSYARAGKEAAKYGEPYIFRCHAGLVEWAAPIILEERLIGSVICGQVLMWEPEDFFWEEIGEMLSGLEVDVQALVKEAKRLEVVSADKVQAAADLLFVVANHITKTGAITLQQRREIAEQQARLGEELQARKVLEQAMKRVEAHSFRVYSLEKEQELITRVRKGDRNGSYRLLNELLADILQKYAGDAKEVKARVLELLVVLSRAAVEGGANLKTLLSLNSQYVEELAKVEGVENLCLWILKITQKFVDAVDESKDIKNLQVIQKAAEYMRVNYTEKLTIDDIAKAVYLSPCYLSKLFKQELGCTIMEFLTKVRVEEAKRLLKNPRYTVMQVASQIGFDDPSYFTKVFKRSEGITPSQYKRKAL